MPEEISGADIIYAQLREGDLLRFDPLAAHQLRGNIEPSSEDIAANLLADFNGQYPILSDNYLVISTRTVAGAHVEIAFLCMDGSDRGVVVEVFEALGTLGTSTLLIVGPTPMDCRGILTANGPIDRVPEATVKLRQRPRRKLIDSTEYAFFALALTTLGIVVASIFWL